VEAFKRELDAPGLCVEAGEFRDRGGHDLRSWYLTAPCTAGAIQTYLDAQSTPLPVT
jgi:hypothetical protein